MQVSRTSPELRARWLIASGLFVLSRRLLEQRMERAGSRDIDGRPERRAIGKIASQHAVLGSRRVDGQARAGSRRANGSERVSRTSPEPSTLIRQSAGLFLSGERTRVACWRRRLAVANFMRPLAALPCALRPILSSNPSACISRVGCGCVASLSVVARL